MTSREYYVTISETDWSVGRSHPPNPKFLTIASLVSPTCPSRLRHVPLTCLSCAFHVNIPYPSRAHHEPVIWPSRDDSSPRFPLS